MLDVLVLENDRRDYERLVMVLGEDEFSFRRAKNTQQAFDAIKTDGHRLDLAILDIDLEEKVHRY